MEKTLPMSLIWHRIQRTMQEDNRQFIQGGAFSATEYSLNHKENKISANVLRKKSIEICKQDAE